MVALGRGHRIASSAEEEAGIEETCPLDAEPDARRQNLRVEAKHGSVRGKNLLNFERTVVSRDKDHAPRRPPAGTRSESRRRAVRSRAAARSFLPLTPQKHREDVRRSAALRGVTVHFHPG